jgi:hypothetical protein
MGASARRRGKRLELGHRNERHSFAMTQRAWLSRARAATRATRRADDFRPTAAIVLRSNANSVRIRCTGKICIPKVTRATSTRFNGEPRRGHNRSPVRTSAHARRPSARCCATVDHCPRRRRGFNVRDSRGRACPETPRRPRCFANPSAYGAPSLARHETARIAPARLSALRVDARFRNRRQVSALRHSSGSGGCS